MPDPRHDGRSDGELERAVDGFLDDLVQDAELEGLTGLPKLEDEAQHESETSLADFEMIRQIGEGGMGVVFEARQRTALGRRVAVKLLRPFASTSGRDRFKREVAAVIALDHPGIVPVVSADIDGEPPFLAMRFIEGVPLNKLLRRLQERARPPERTEQLRRFVENDVLARGSSGNRTCWRHR